MDLLPCPRAVHPARGCFTPSAASTLHLPAVMEPPEELAVESLRVLSNERLGKTLRVQRGSADGAQGGIVARIDPRRSEPDRSMPCDRELQGYRLVIEPEEVQLTAPSGVGLLNGLRTLRQLLLAYADAWPCMAIDDSPDFAVRGLSFDVSRGRMPTLATLKELVDVLAGLKVNVLQLYIEHTFAFRFNPHIGRDCAPLDADDIRALDAYCAARRVHLVPCIASFGHMGFILNLPEYRHLAEIEPDKPWHEMTWRERMRGLTLDPCNPQARELLERMYDELVPLFSAPWVHVSADETYDLGRGKNRQRAEREGVGQLYLEHLCWLHGLCNRYGKRMLFWGDIIKKYPDLIAEVPPDAVALNWGYEAETDYASTEQFRRAGLETWVCPGTSSWNRIINDIGAAEINIRRYAQAGLKYGAAGLLNTDWGDEGHFNMLATSWHPIYLGAALGWNASAPTQDEFDRVFSSMRFGDPVGRGLALVRRVLETSQVLRSWPLLAASFAETRHAGIEACADRLAAWRTRSLEAADWFDAALRAESAQDAREMALVCRINALLAEKLRLAAELPEHDAIDSDLAKELSQFAEACESAASDYERVWHARNRPERLSEILAVFHRLAKEARALTVANSR